MAIFFIIVFTVYFLVNLYLYIKGHRALAGAGYHTRTYTFIFLILASTFIAGKILEYRFTTVFTDILNVIGGFWMAFMLYGFLIWLWLYPSAGARPFHLVPDDIMQSSDFGSLPCYRHNLITYSDRIYYSGQSVANVMILPLTGLGYGGSNYRMWLCQTYISAV
jgi:hypothetical protein